MYCPLQIAGAVNTAKEPDVFLYAQVFVKRKFLRHVTDRLLDLSPLSAQIEAGNTPIAARGWQNTRQHSNRG